MVLADTSVWVDFLRSGAKSRAAGLRSILDAGEVITCGPVASELMAGASGETADRLWATLDSLPWAPLDRLEWRWVGAIGGALRRGGKAAALTDVAIAVAASAQKANLWTLDADFARIATELPNLALYEPD